MRACVPAAHGAACPAGRPKLGMGASRCQGGRRAGPAHVRSGKTLTYGLTHPARKVIQRGTPGVQGDPKAQEHMGCEQKLIFSSMPPVAEQAGSGTGRAQRSRRQAGAESPQDGPGEQPEPQLQYVDVRLELETPHACMHLAAEMHQVATRAAPSAWLEGAREGGVKGVEDPVCVCTPVPGEQGFARRPGSSSCLPP